MLCVGKAGGGAGHGGAAGVAEEQSMLESK